MNFTKKEYTYFFDVANPIILHLEYQKNKQFFQHADVSVYDHCLSVALKSYEIALRSKKNYDLKAIIRAALLHDFFLYDWHILAGRKRWHGFRHPKIAFINASKYFELSKKEKNIILSHMWPLTFFVFPKSKEAWLVMRVDKKTTIREMKKKEEKIEIC